MHFAFFARTEAEVRLRILEGRRSRLEERLDRSALTAAKNRERLDDYTAELQRHGLDSAEREVRWLNELIDGRADPATARSIAATQAFTTQASTPASDTQPSNADPTIAHPGMKENPMGSVRVAIVGVGNCASSLVQGVEYYKDADPSGQRPRADARQVRRLPRQRRRVRRRVRRRRQEGRPRPRPRPSAPPRTTPSRSPTSPPTGVTVQRGHTLDGLGKYYRQTIEESDAEPVDIVQTLKDTQVDVLVSYLPVGSEDAAKFYAQCAIDAGVAFVNALPVFIASDPDWAAKFEAAGVPVIGDDIKSQVGATITHRVMAKLFEDRGVVLDRTYQLNVGGNMDFKNMLERDRLESKKISKTQAVTSNLGHDLGARNVHIGPSDYVPWLDDRKWAYVRLEGRAFGDVPLNLEYKLEVWDSPNSPASSSTPSAPRRSPRTAASAAP